MAGIKISALPTTGTAAAADEASTNTLGGVPTVKRTLAQLVIGGLLGTGPFVLGGNVALGANFISRAGTAAGLSLDTSNNATFSGNLTVSGTGTSSIAGLFDISGASAGQIKFPATQNASADTNTLDDYEEGTWTPNQGAGLTVVGAFSSVGIYTKVGRKVTVSGNVVGATSVALTAGGIITSNLPFTVDAAVPYIGSITNNAVTAGGQSYAAGGTTNLYGDTVIAANTAIFFSVTYFI